MMMQTFAPAQRPSSPPPAGPQQAEATGAEDPRQRTQTLGTVKTVDRPVGFGQPAAEAQDGERTTLPPPPLTTPPGAPADDSAAAEDQVADTGDLGDWIPGADEIGEDTSLIDLDADDVEELDTDELLEEGGAVEEAAAADVEDAPTVLGPLSFLLKYILADEFLDNAEAKGWPAVLVKVLGKLRWVHAVGVGVLLVGLIIMIVALAASDDEPEPAGGPPAVADQPQAVPSAPGGKPGKPAAGAAGKQPQAAGTGGKTVAADAPDKPVPEAGKSCRGIDEYPSFPWKTRLTEAVSKAGAKGVCGLFGSAPSTLADAFAGKAQVGPSGYDLIKGGGLLEVFPVGKPNRRGPSMEFLFVGDKLFEIRFSYWDTAKKLDTKSFGDLFEKPEEQPTDHLGRKITRLTDGEVILELLEEKWYGRKLRTLVFASATIRSALEGDRAAREKAEKLVAEGDSLFGQRKYEDAIAKFDAASAALPRLGRALAKKALVLTRTEDFEQVEATAKKVLETSREQRVRAEAFGLIALAALFGGDKDKAITQFKAASAADPANALFAISHGELESGKYEMDRVALTAARMECLRKKKTTATYNGLLARGNFPSSEAYFKVLRRAKKSPKFEKRKRDYMKYECR
jgi:tetratricopeptide (TPR) repeat protein